MSLSRKQMLDEFQNDIQQIVQSIKPHGVEMHEEAYSKCIDMVLNPPHYNQNGLETIDYMRAYSTKEEFIGHCRLTALKYLSRMNAKDEPLENARKANWYIEKMIEEME